MASLNRKSQNANGKWQNYMLNLKSFLEFKNAFSDLSFELSF